jgi:hypothetical protein
LESGKILVRRKKFSALHQLISVLPPSKSYLLPKKYQSLIEELGELADMYPKKCLLDIQGKQNEWQATPLLPTLHFNILTECVDALSNGRTPNGFGVDVDVIDICRPRHTVVQHPRAQPPRPFKPREKPSFQDRKPKEKEKEKGKAKWTEDDLM